MDKDIPYKTIEEMQIYYICKALRKAKGNRLEASKMLGITDRTLYTKLIKYNLHDVK